VISMADHDGAESEAHHEERERLQTIEDAQRFLREKTNRLSQARRIQKREVWSAEVRLTPAPRRNEIGIAGLPRS
jgi:hypothetical protein